MNERLPVQGAHGDLLRLVATGKAESRADLARLSGLAASSVSLRVEELIDVGLLAEEGSGTSRAAAAPASCASRPEPACWPWPIWAPTTYGSACST